MLLALFFLAFVVGPALFFKLLRHNGQMWPLALAAVLLAGLGFLLRKGSALPLGSDMARAGESILLLWLAWVLLMVLVVRAVRRIYTTPAARRWSRALGAMGTTLPWFGLAAAKMMAD